MDCINQLMISLTLYLNSSRGSSQTFTDSHPAGEVCLISLSLSVGTKKVLDPYQLGKNLAGMLAENDFLRAPELSADSHPQDTPPARRTLHAGWLSRIAALPIKRPSSFPSDTLDLSVTCNASPLISPAADLPRWQR